jgi:hypothetical protein
MSNANIVHSTTWAPAVFVSSGSPGAAVAFDLKTSTEEVFTVGLSAATTMIGSNRVPSLRRPSNRARRSPLVAAQPSAAVEVTMAPPVSPQPPGVDRSEAPANAAPGEGPPKARATRKTQLAIDSLQNYELIKPIPVVIESLGDKVFVAEAPDLNVSITGNSVGAAFLLLKEHIVTVYEGYRNKKGLDPERARQLSIFDKYIGKTRRSWF